MYGFNFIPSMANTTSFHTFPPPSQQVKQEVKCKDSWDFPKKMLVPCNLRRM